jgi:serine/threonine-protein kinase
MTTPSISSFLDVLRDSRLLEPEQVEETVRDLTPGCDDASTLAPLLVKRGWLTNYQADRLLRGRPQDLTLGPYHLLELLGEGGMGQVFKARHQRLNRLVALKIIRPERLLQNPEAIRRFHREAQSAAALSHPNIVIIYDADEVNKVHFIAMEYVDGIDLARLVKETGPLAVAQAGYFIRQAALGLQHAFVKGLVHRDIKPSNLLVTGPRGGRDSLGPGRRQVGPGDETIRDSVSKPTDSKQTTGSPPFWMSPNAQVKILDMGLARLTERETDDPVLSSLTHEGSVVGTPDYIAPEQARNSHLADIRSDLYSLGGTFYFLLTGRPPFPEGSAVEKLLMHQLDDPQPLEEQRPDVPPGVVMIIRKLMAKSPDHRYQEPAEVAEALAVLGLTGAAPVVAKPPAPVGDRPTVTAIVNVAGLPTVPPVGTPPPAPTPPSTLVHPITPATSPPLLSETPLPATVAADSESQAGKKLRVFKGHRGWVMSVAFSRDRNNLASGGVDGSVRLRNFSKSRPKETVLPQVHQAGVHSLAFSPDGRLLATGSGSLDGLIFLWDVKGEEPEPVAALRGHTAQVEALAFSPDGRLLASAGTDRLVRLWDITPKGADERATLKGHGDTIKTLAISPDSRIVASAGQDETIRLWSVGRIWTDELAVLRGPMGHVLSVCFSPDGHTLASGSLDQVVRLWDLGGKQSGERSMIKLKEHPGVVRLVLFTPDGKHLVSVGSQGQAILWDTVKCERIHKWMMPAAPMVSSVALTFDGRYLALGASDGSVGVYRLEYKKDAEKTSDE